MIQGYAEGSPYGLLGGGRGREQCSSKTSRFTFGFSFVIWFGFPPTVYFGVISKSRSEGGSEIKKTGGLDELDDPQVEHGQLLYSYSCIFHMTNASFSFLTDVRSWRIPCPSRLLAMVLAVTLFLRLLPTMNSIKWTTMVRFRLGLLTLVLFPTSTSLCSPHPPRVECPYPF